MLQRGTTGQTVAYIQQQVKDSSLLGCFALSLSKQFLMFHVHLQGQRSKKSGLDCWSLKLKVLRFFLTTVNIYPSSQRNIPEEPHQHRYENLNYLTIVN
jgi:hypothetical protein